MIIAKKVHVMPATLEKSLKKKKPLNVLMVSSQMTSKTIPFLLLLEDRKNKFLLCG